MNKIYISSIGEVNEEMMIIIERHVKALLGFEVERYKSFPEPEYAFDIRRRQYGSALILQNLSRACPPDAVRFLAVTEVDLFIPMVTFVYGQAQLSGRIALVSLARLSQEFYGLRPDKELKMRRSRKEVAHELGHTFGLVHCRDRSCLMSLSTEIVQIDVKSDDFCRNCWIILEESLTKARKEIRKNKVAELGR